MLSGTFSSLIQILLTIDIYTRPILVSFLTFAYPRWQAIANESHSHSHVHPSTNTFHTHCSSYKLDSRTTFVFWFYDFHYILAEFSRSASLSQRVCLFFVQFSCHYFSFFYCSFLLWWSSFSFLFFQRYFAVACFRIISLPSSIFTECSICSDFVIFAFQFWNILCLFWILFSCLCLSGDFLDVLWFCALLFDQNPLRVHCYCSKSIRNLDSTAALTSVILMNCSQPISSRLKINLKLILANKDRCKQELNV